MKTTLPLLFAGLLAAGCLPSLAQANPQINFANVSIGGGGYATGMVAHPQNTTLIYARTDVGGVFRYNALTQSWTALMDQFVGQPYYSCEGLCVDPSDTGLGKVYALVGNVISQTSMQAYLLYSANQGALWTDTKLPTSIVGDANGDYRWAGDRIAIDPNCPGRIFVGTRQNGLWYNNSANSGNPQTSNWVQFNPTTQVPVGTGTGTTRNGENLIGITFVAFYKQGGVTSGQTSVIYVGVSGLGVYKTTNAGSTWSAISSVSLGGPIYPVQGRVDNSGHLYVTAGNDIAGGSYGGVWEHDSGQWTNMTPQASAGQEFSGLSINPNNQNDILVAVGNTDSTSSAIYLSTSGPSTTSASWTTETGTQQAPDNTPWQPTGYFNTHISSVLFAPTATNPNEAWYGDWYDVWMTPNVTAASPTWANYEQGFEETYILALRATSPNGSSANPLFSGLEDDCGFTHNTLFSFPTQADKFTGTKDTTSIDVYEGNNNYVFRTGDSSGNNGFAFGSTNGGTTWTQLAAPPNTSTPQGGQIAVSATNSNLVVWLPLNGTPQVTLTTTPFYSTNGGSTWTAATGPASLTQTWFTDNYPLSQELASNKGTTNCFYVYHPVHGFFTSNTGSSAGSTFTLQSGNGLPTFTAGSFARFGVKTVPGKNGQVWVYLSGSTAGQQYGIWTSTNSGQNFTLLNGANPIVSADALAFGAPAPGSGEPAAVYCLGQKAGDPNDYLYESDDMGVTWTPLNNFSGGNLFGDKAVELDADRTIYQQIYVGTYGSGIFSNVLFSDGFQAGSPSSAWTVDSGTWSVVSAGGSEQYDVVSTTGVAIAQAGSSSWTDYSVSADITPLTLPGGATLQLALRFADPDDNYKALLYPGALDIVKRTSVGGVVTQTTLAQKSFSVTVGTQHHVELVAIGSSLTLYVDGVSELTATDSTFGSGMIALGANSATGNFDNVVVNPQ